MLVNNLIFLALWWIFFRQFNDIAGWKMQDMVALMVVGIGGYGLYGICFGGIKFLSRLIISGDLDPFMTQPKNILLQIAGSRSHAKNWGHLLTSAVLTLFGGLLSSLPLIVLSIVSSCFVFTAMAIIAHSLPFWLGSIESFSKKYCEALFLFALYPTNIYSGILQLVMFTLIPAGIIGYLPVELIRDFTWGTLLLLLACTSGLVMLAYAFFYRGLRRYESGNQFGLRL